MIGGFVRFMAFCISNAMGQGGPFRGLGELTIMTNYSFLVQAFVFSLAAAVSTGAQAEDASTLKDGISSAISGTVSAGKDMLVGIQEGVTQGRKEGESEDGAILISSKDELMKYVTVSVLKVEDLGNERCRVTIGVKNDGDKPVRLTHLEQAKSVLLLDEDGFSSLLENPMTQGRDVTVQGRSATRVRYEFANVESKPKTLRLLDMDISIP